jgi:hypothetical protein
MLWYYASPMGFIPNNLSRADLVAFARNAALQLATGHVTGLLPEQASAMSAAIAADAAELAAADAEQVALRAASIASTTTAQEIAKRILQRLQGLKYSMKGAECAGHEYDAVGFNPPVRKRQTITPQMPEKLAAAGFSYGVNALSFVGNNKPSSVTYVIEAKTAEASRYSMIGATTAQRFKHKGVIPGVMYQYRVRAQAARGRVSNWSNEAVVYRV